MKNLNEHYRFHFYRKQENLFPERALVCPGCKELLARSDIESFMACPYCGYKFDPAIPLDDYILEPMINKWMSSLPGYSFESIDSFPEF